MKMPESTEKQHLPLWIKIVLIISIICLTYYIIINFGEETIGFINRIISIIGFLGMSIFCFYYAHQILHQRKQQRMNSHSPTK